MMRAIITTA